eukprot:1553526-Lingulodinium_polyedra.AAC.1
MAWPTFGKAASPVEQLGNAASPVGCSTGVAAWGMLPHQMECSTAASGVHWRKSTSSSHIPSASLMCCVFQQVQGSEALQASEAS